MDNSASFSFNIEDFDSSMVANILDEKYDICVRSGFHCAPLVHKYNQTEKQGMVRASISEFNTKEEIDIFIKSLYEIYYDLTK